MRLPGGGNFPAFCIYFGKSTLSSFGIECRERSLFDNNSGGHTSFLAVFE